MEGEPGAPPPLDGLPVRLGREVPFDRSASLRRHAQHLDGGWGNATRTCQANI